MSSALTWRGLRPSFRFDYGGLKCYWKVGLRCCVGRDVVFISNIMLVQFVQGDG